MAGLHVSKELLKCLVSERIAVHAYDFDSGSRDPALTSSCAPNTRSNQQALADRFADCDVELDERRALHIVVSRKRERDSGYDRSRMTITDEQFERLLRDSAVPWSVNLSTKGDRLISVGEWLAFAQSKLTDDVSDAALEAATDAYLCRIGGEKLQEAHMFNWLRRLAGRDELPTGWTYSVPAAFFGDENFGLADQLRTAITARRTPGNS